MRTLLAILSVPAILVPVVAASSPVMQRFATGVDYYNPTLNGGSMLDNAGYGLGEPLNVIISGQSSPRVLTDKGFLNYARSIEFSTECLGIHLGSPQSANLGDGNGWLNQTVELRDDYWDPILGTCMESAIGGNHFRVWRQNGTHANSGALFLAVSWEEDAKKKHDIVPNGYNIGRNALVANAVGKTRHGGVTYNTVAWNVTGLLAPGSERINHGMHSFPRSFVHEGLHAEIGRYCSRWDHDGAYSDDRLSVYPEISLTLILSPYGLLAWRYL